MIDGRKQRSVYTGFEREPATVLCVSRKFYDEETREEIRKTGADIKRP